MTIDSPATAHPMGPNVDPALASRVLAAIDEAETVAFLQDLIRCPTVNPPGDVRAAAAVCAAKLRDAGFETVVVGPTPEHQNVVATLAGRGNGPRLAFNAHYDVVPTGEESGWTHPPFGGEVHAGRVYGRGAGDDKASVTAQVMAGVALARSGVPLAGTLIVTEVADEETAGNLGAGFIVREGHVEADYVIVGEQTKGQICIGERGAVAVGLTVFGATGHAATPWMGANAIEGMALVIAALQQELWPRLAARTHPQLAASTATISLIEGGIKTNVIPDRCAIHIDRRILPEETPASVLAEIREIAEGALAAAPGFRVEVIEKMNRPARLTSADSPVALALSTATRFLGHEPIITGFFAGTDAKHFAPKGWPTLVMGPGDPATAHTQDEWVGIDELMEATRLYALTALALLGADAAQ
jgi:acetylornithine deacetylase/succinyl-diaminopimelate desuccinylase family protein